MGFLRHIISLIAGLLFSALSAAAMPMMPTVSHHAEFFPHQEAVIAEHTNAHFAARAPPLTSANVAITGAAVAEQGSGIIMHGHETHVVSLGIGVGLDAPNRGTDPGTVYQVRFDPAHPGRPDPAFSVDTSTFTSGVNTANGGVCNSRQFWSSWSNKSNNGLSQANQTAVANGRAPVVDDDWLSVFPEHADFRGQQIVHHHMDYGQYAIPVPRGAHNNSPGFSIWHPPRGAE